LLDREFGDRDSKNIAQDHDQPDGGSPVGGSGSNGK
jgi:hypothetical protein